MELSVSFALLFIGFVQSQMISDPTTREPQKHKVTTELPLCEFEKIAKCIELGVRSYIRNTKGEAAAREPPDMLSSQMVGMAVSGDLSNPNHDIHTQCRVIDKIDMKEMADCTVEMTQGCQTEIPDEEEEFRRSILPATRSVDAGTSIRAMKQLCSQECLETDPVRRMAKVRLCWLRHRDDIEAFLDDGAVKDCNVVSEYMQCHWNESVGCAWFEMMTRFHVNDHLDIIKQCQIPLPPEAFSEPELKPSAVFSNAHRVLLNTGYVVSVTAGLMVNIVGFIG